MPSYEATWRRKELYATSQSLAYRLRELGKVLQTPSQPTEEDITEFCLQAAKLSGGVKGWAEDARDCLKAQQEPIEA